MVFLAPLGANTLRPSSTTTWVSIPPPRGGCIWKNRNGCRLGPGRPQEFTRTGSTKRTQWIGDAGSKTRLKSGSAANRLTAVSGAGTLTVCLCCLVAAGATGVGKQDIARNQGGTWTCIGRSPGGRASLGACRGRFSGMVTRCVYEPGATEHRVTRASQVLNESDEWEEVRPPCM